VISIWTGYHAIDINEGGVGSGGVLKSENTLSPKTKTSILGAFFRENGPFEGSKNEEIQ